MMGCRIVVFFFLQAEDGIRYRTVTGVQTCALPISGEHDVPWLFSGTGLHDGDRFGRYGCEIDARAAESPRDTITLATIPNLFAPGRSAQMSYYETPAGAKVFASGVLNFVGSIDSPPASQLLENLWLRLSLP